MSAPHNFNATPLPSGKLAAADGGVRLRVEYPANPALQRVAVVAVRVESPGLPTPLAAAFGTLTVRLPAEMSSSPILWRTSSTLWMPTLSLNAGNLFSVRNASIFCPPLGSRSMLA